MHWDTRALFAACQSSRVKEAIRGLQENRSQYLLSQHSVLLVLLTGISWDITLQQFTARICWHCLWVWGIQFLQQSHPQCSNCDIESSILLQGKCEVQIRCTWACLQYSSNSFDCNPVRYHVNRGMLCLVNPYLLLIDRYIGTCLGPWTRHPLTYSLQFQKNGKVTGTCTTEEGTLLKVKTVFAKHQGWAKWVADEWNVEYYILPEHH